MKDNSLNEVIQIEIDKVHMNPYQPRNIFNDEALNNLANSIKKHGLIQPVSVRIVNDEYELIVGERRVRASKLLGLKEIPAIVVDISDKESSFVALVENLEREDLNFIEEAYAMKNIMHIHNLSQKELSIKLGLNQSTISNKLRILAFNDIVKEKIVSSNLTERHARALLKLKSDSEQIHVINLIKKNELNVKKTEVIIDKMILAYKKKNTFAKSVINYKIYLNTLKNAYKSIRDTGADIEYTEEKDENYAYIKFKIPIK
ncbi:ParB/RepB/Spo0J family partition protein [Helicovermis profundi]|uniref:Nucleoid occlusion protein n=1 Tax=Helicovermis profundi TaxID=3065157 RepID=A0AAU9EE93_9FIRM|nr:nucleoid occlusion protein [Clostridia bacterium S502]